MGIARLHTTKGDNDYNAFVIVVPHFLRGKVT